MLKKILLALLMCFPLVGCSSEEKVLETKKTNELENMNITFHYGEVVKKIQPTVVFNESYYYEPTSQDEEFLDLIMTVENKSNETLKLNKLLNADLNINGSQKVADLLIETLDGTSVEKTFSLESNEKTRIHVYATVPKKETVKNIKLDLDVDGETYVLKTTFTDIQATKDVKKIPYTFSMNEQWKMTFKKISTMKELKPSKPIGVYSYYKAKNKDDVLLVLKTEIQNQTSQPLPLKGIVGSLFYVDGVAYDSYCVFENEKHSNLDTGTQGHIATNKKMTVYYFAEIPDSQKGKPIEVRITNTNSQFYVK